MASNTLFLSKLLGPVIVLAGLATLIRQDDMKKMMKNMIESPLILFINGLYESTFGIAIVLYHHLWNSPAAVIITLFGWIMIMEGAFEMLASRSHIKRIVHSVNIGFINPWGVLMFLVGAYLAWVGYGGFFF